MQLTGKQITEKQIITNVGEKSIQQQGVDLRLKRIGRIDYRGDMGEMGFIPADGRTSTPKTEWYESEFEQYSITLIPGYYEVEFMEGCNIPANCSLQLKSRSSVVRCGGEIRSGQFDAGFRTDNIGCFLKVEIPMSVEIGARMAQALVFESYPVENLYDGQWQGDKQRKS